MSAPSPRGAPEKLIVDTNVLVSALVRPDGPPGFIVERAHRYGVFLFAPESVLRELERIVTVKLGLPVAEADRAAASLAVEWLEERIYEDFLDEAKGAIADPDDVPVVAAGLALDLPVVSGDPDFHPLEEDVVETWTPRDLWNLLAAEEP